LVAQLKEGKGKKVEIRKHLVCATKRGNNCLVNIDQCPSEAEKANKNISISSFAGPKIVFGFPFLFCFIPACKEIKRKLRLFCWGKKGIVGGLECLYVWSMRLSKLKGFYTPTESLRRLASS